MIDTASFLNSKDIADYWCKIGWNSYCTPLQSAYMHHYLDLEYYREEPQGIRRILKAFSAFEKEEIGSDLFALAYHAILEEEKSKREREELSCFTDEGLQLAGLK